MNIKTKNKLKNVNRALFEGCNKFYEPKSNPTESHIGIDLK